MPIRKIPKNYRNITGIVTASKAGAAAQFESTLERDFLALLEFYPEVKAFDPQQVEIEWEGILNQCFHCLGWSTRMV